MRKAYKTIIIAVLVVWIFASGLVLGTFITRKNYRKSLQENGETVSAQAPQTTLAPVTEGIKIDIVTDVAPVTQAPTTEPFSLEVPTDGGNITTFSSVTEKTLTTPSGNKEIAEALVKAINTTKSTKAFSAQKHEETNFIIDSVTGGNAVKGIVEGIINKVGNKPDATYSFSNGVDNNGSGQTPTTAIPPLTGAASLSEAAVKSASAQPNAQGGYDLTVTLIDETQSLSQKSQAHDGVFDTPDMASMPFPSGFKLNEMAFNYSGATIKACVNSDGRLISIEYLLPISQGHAQGSMLGATVEVSLHGTYSANMSFTY